MVLLFVFLFLTGFLEHVDNIAFQYFIAECACLLKSLPSYSKQTKVCVGGGGGEGETERERREGRNKDGRMCTFCSVGPYHP